MAEEKTAKKAEEKKAAKNSSVEKPIEKKAEHAIEKKELEKPTEKKAEKAPGKKIVEKKRPIEEKAVEKKTFTERKFEPRRSYHSRNQFERKNFYSSGPVKKPDFKKKDFFPDNKAFNRWSFKDVTVKDIGLAKYINLQSVIIPHSFGKKTRGRGEKENLNIVERLVNKTMRSGQGKRKMSGHFIRGRGSCGKKLQAMKIIEQAFEIVEKKTSQNPIQILVRAIENSAPREDVTRIKRGGIAYSIAVDVSPQTRLDEAIKNIALAGFANSFNKKISAEEALAEELIAASKNDSKSTSVKRRDEVERIAKASR